MKDKNLSYKNNANLKSKTPFLCSRTFVRANRFWIWIVESSTGAIYRERSEAMLLYNWDTWYIHFGLYIIWLIRSSCLILLWYSWYSFIRKFKKLTFVFIIFWYWHNQNKWRWHFLSAYDVTVSEWRFRLAKRNLKKIFVCHKPNFGKLLTFLDNGVSVRIPKSIFM